MKWKRLISGHRNSLRTIIALLTIALLIVLLDVVRKTPDLTGGECVSILISIIEAVGLLLSLVIAISQFIDSKEISRATFIMELNKSFVENADYINLYNNLQDCLDDKCENKPDPLQECPECKLDIKKSVISNYLTFFETFNVLLNNGVLKFEMIDDLFGYRFFLAVHSGLIQQQKLKPQYQNFKNIYQLEKAWIEYRIKIRKIKYEDYEKACLGEYKNDKDIYLTRLLMSIIQKDAYDKLIS